MLKTRQFLLVVGVCLLAFTHAAVAAEQPTALFGKWYEKNATGGTMIVEFTSSTMSMSPITASGGPARAARTIKVSYQESGKND